MTGRQTRTGEPARQCCPAEKRRRRAASSRPIESAADNAVSTSPTEKRPPRSALDGAAQGPIARPEIAAPTAGMFPATSPPRLERAAGDQQRTYFLVLQGSRESQHQFRFRRRLHFKFQIAADMNAFRRRSHLHQTPSVLLALRQEELHVLQHGA